MGHKSNYTQWSNFTGFSNRLEEIADPKQDLNPPEPNQWREKRLEVLKALLRRKGLGGTVSPRQAEIIRLRLSGLRIKEISRLLNISSATIEAHLKASREKLRKYVEGRV